MTSVFHGRNTEPEVGKDYGNNCRQQQRIKDVLGSTVGGY